MGSLVSCELCQPDYNVFITSNFSRNSFSPHANKMLRGLDRFPWLCQIFQLKFSVWYLEVSYVC